MANASKSIENGPPRNIGAPRSKVINSTVHTYNRLAVDFWRLIVTLTPEYALLARQRHDIKTRDNLLSQPLLKYDGPNLSQGHR